MNSVTTRSVTNVLAIAAFALCGLASISTASATTRYILQGTYIDSGYYGSPGLFIPRNHYTAIGNPLVVNCLGPGPCVIQGDLFIQSGKSDVTGNQYNLCLFVDGTSAPNCQIVGSTPADNTITNGSTSQVVPGVTPGVHSVQAFFLTYKGTNVFNYTSNYRVYTQ